jgi:hypothetical protein
MKISHLIAAIAISVLGLVPDVQAQTRSTACNAATPNNALCVTWGAVSTATDGAPISGVTYRIEQRTGSTGTWATLATGITASRYLVQNLAPGAYEFRAFANCSTCSSESASSNIAGGTATRIPQVPTAPVITIAVVISSDRAPVYRVVSGKRGEFAGLLPAGAPCSGAVLFRFRNKSYRRVAVTADDLEGLSPSQVYAAPCGSGSDS